MTADRELDALSRVRDLEREVARLYALLNTPETVHFLEGVKRETAHQVERWGEGHDLRKEPEGFFWVLGWLSGKAVHAMRAGDFEKARHHTISSAALLANWHRRITEIEGGAK